MRNTALLLSFLSFILITKARSVDDIDRDLENVATFKVLRAMTNQTKEDNLNLPANASSIRENITDNFSCENRTYGYYADVENDCQIFHVCLPSQTTSGRNITYKWSFICPNETIFNQEVLVCTRPIDSIPCEESEMYYDVNNEFGKTNQTKEDDKNSSKEQSGNNKDQEKESNKPNNPNKDAETLANTNKEMNNNRPNNQRRKPTRKQNIVFENESKKEKLQTMESYDISQEKDEDKDKLIQTPETEKVKDTVPVMIDAVIESEPSSFEDMAEIPLKDMLESARIVAERSMRWKRKDRRGSRRRSYF